MVQLYNPDQQVLVKQHPGSWSSLPYFEFEMPQQTFRKPSTSALDRTQSDPTVSEATPKVVFRWKRDGKFSKDLICNLVGKSTNPDGSKKRNKEPDIPVAFFRSMKEVTVYEPNLSRVDIEDPKGLEVVFLLCAAVIRDVYFGQVKQAFNLSDTSQLAASIEAPRKRSSTNRGNASYASSSASPNLSRREFQPVHARRHSGPPHPDSRPSLRVQTSNPRPPPTDPRSQWEIDAETARLKKQFEREEQERKRAEAMEIRRVKAMLEAEEKEARRRKQAEIDKETERLRREQEAEKKRLKHKKTKPQSPAPQQYIPQPPLPPRHPHPPRHSASTVQQPYQQPAPPLQYYQTLGPGPGFGFGPDGRSYLQPPVFHGTGPVPISGGPSSGYFAEPVLKPKRSSFFGLRSVSDAGGQKLLTKRSSLF